jgi:hypothetical protein
MGEATNLKKKKELRGLTIQYTNAGMLELTLMRRDVYIIPPEVISVAFFINPTHQ